MGRQLCSSALSPALGGAPEERVYTFSELQGKDVQEGKN
jgi:hypothetical protein